jgi:hypothetical protein
MSHLHPQDETKSCYNLGAECEKIFYEKCRDGVKLSRNREDDMRRNIDFTATYEDGRVRTFQIKGPKQLKRSRSHPVYTTSHILVEISLRTERDGWLFKDTVDYIVFFRKNDGVIFNFNAFKDYCVENIKWDDPPLKKQYKDYRIKLRTTNQFHEKEELSIIPIADLLPNISHEIFEHRGLDIKTNEENWPLV